MKMTTFGVIAPYEGGHRHLEKYKNYKKSRKAKMPKKLQENDRNTKKKLQNL